MHLMLTTKEVAAYLNINEKMVYTLISSKGLPASKVTGKWLFPKHLVERWVEQHTINYPERKTVLPPYEGILILAGSNDLLLEKAIQIFNNAHGEGLAVFGNMGSTGGLQALRAKKCHIATCHLLQENRKEYNFEYAHKELHKMPAIINFCRREQGILVQKNNPKNIQSIKDLANKNVCIVNRSVGTGTRLLIDHELKKAGMKSRAVAGYEKEMPNHLSVGLEVLSGRADAGPAIRAVAGALGLDFIPLRWERYDLMIDKDRFFERGIQQFLGILNGENFRSEANRLTGYDLNQCGEMLYPLNEDRDD